MPTYHGACHCGAIEFEIETDDAISQATRCNCSLCRRKNALMHRVPPERFHLLKGADNLALYQWNTGTAKHYFCKTCGIYPFHMPRAAPDQYTVNVACLDGVDLSKLKINAFDGQAFSLETK
jgi:hypothetical protein